MDHINTQSIVELVFSFLGIFFLIAWGQYATFLLLYADNPFFNMIPLTIPVTVSFIYTIIYIHRSHKRTLKLFYVDIGSCFLYSIIQPIIPLFIYLSSDNITLNTKVVGYTFNLFLPYLSIFFEYWRAKNNHANGKNVYTFYFSHLFIGEPSPVDNPSQPFYRTTVEPSAP